MLSRCRHVVLTVFVGAVVVSANPRSARAWDPIGHLLTGQIAYDHLTPAAREAVNASIATFNEKEGAEYTFVIAPCWMDDIRDQTREFNAWHYVNLPYTPDGRPFPDGSEGPNVLWGIERCLAILKGEVTDPAIDRDQALVMLLHLIGDVHQPLHATSRIDENGESDLGGNKVEVSNLVDPALAIFSRTSGNLHWFWDGAHYWTYRDGHVVGEYKAPLMRRGAPLIAHREALPIVREVADRLTKKFPPSSLSPQADPETWVSESHELGYKFAYGNLPGGDAANPATLKADYVAMAREIAQKRIAEAGHRIANLLNEIYK